MNSELCEVCDGTVQTMNRFVEECTVHYLPRGMQGLRVLEGDVVRIEKKKKKKRRVMLIRFTC